MNKYIYLLILGLISVSCSQPKQIFLESIDFYFNQSLPGDSAVIFAPGIFSLSDRLESNIAFSPDGKECFFGTLEIKDRKVSYKIYQSKYVNSKWTKQIEAPFSINNNFSDPVFSADGKKLYFNNKGDIWFVERNSDGWSEAKILPFPVNSDATEGSITVSKNGDIYISSKRPDGFGGIDIWRINRLADQSLQAENLGPIMNSTYFDYSPFIAQDGSYLIFGSYRARRDGILYISFNKGNGEWTTPLNMNSCGAKINNTMAHHSNPSLSPDGKFLFFRRHEADTIMDVYWVSAKVIEKLKIKAMQETDFLESKDAYFGLTPPGLIPEVFAPGIVSDTNWREHSQIAISPNGKEIYWSRFSEIISEQIYYSTFEADKWTKPTLVDFVKDDLSLINGGPTLSHDGNKLFFYSKDRPEGLGYIDAWYVERTNHGWSKPINAGEPYNSAKDDRPPILTKLGNAYNMGRNFAENKYEFLRFNYSDGEFSDPTIVSIFKDFPSWWPLFVSPDESYIIFPSNHKDGFGGLDLYISFKDKTNSWGKPINMGNEINSNLSERFPIVSPDGKYLFFMRHTKTWDIFWVSAKIIDQLRK